MGAQIAHRLALILSAAAEPHHNGEFIPTHRPGLSNMDFNLSLYSFMLNPLRRSRGNYLYHSHVSAIYLCHLFQSKGVAV